MATAESFDPLQGWSRSELFLNRSQDQKDHVDQLVSLSHNAVKIVLHKALTGSVISEYDP